MDRLTSPLPMFGFLLRKFHLWLPAIILSGCITRPPVPVAPESDFLHFAETGFHINVRKAEIRYRLVLHKKNSADIPLLLSVQYQNPADRFTPFSETVHWPGTESLELLSPPLRNLERDRVYHITIDLIEPSTSEPAETLSIPLFSNIDTKSHGR